MIDEDRDDLRDWLLTRVRRTPLAAALHDARAFARYHLTPSGVAHHVRHRWQRLWRGWSDTDNWSADWYWTQIIVEMLEAQAAGRVSLPPHPTRLDERGWPDHYTDAEWWDGTVAYIIRSFRLHLWLEDHDWRWRGIGRADGDLDAEEFHRALLLLVEYWHAFWI